MSTPHNRAVFGEIEKTVIMPGDPLRAKFIAENFLHGAVLVNDIRNIYAYTGMYKNTPLSVMASGIGIPSMGIYSYELFNYYGVESIIRVGSAGAYTNRLKLYDVVLAESVWSESTYAKTQNGYEGDTMLPDKELNEAIIKTAESLKTPLLRAKVHCTDAFYSEGKDYYRSIYKNHGCECVDMESFALLRNADVLKKKAACLFTIADSFPTGEKASAEERERAFTNMIELALETAQFTIQHDFT